MTEGIKIVIADDQALVRGALASLLDLEADFEIVGQAGRGDEVLDLVTTTGASVALLDIEMPGLDGLAVARQLRDADTGCRSIIVTTFGRPGYLRRALESGASGFVVKDTPSDQLADAVRRVAQGLRVVDPLLATESLVTGSSPLTTRETDVLLALRSEGSIADVARALHLSEGTIRNHLSSAIGKTRARNGGEAVRIAADNGWLIS
ncbi:response regulator transcription factor [Agreia sp. COWG]|uniref:response regulator transcription factor n=1 Tax=Agreia sp. COWG TaxID=2773266 RepID=UPI0019257715|nr:response regulator transcription factor [Agreia sp. COWG]CAD5989909.1 Transcriptional regulatory protein DesR [Agreia sp. COWG]